MAARKVCRVPVDVSVKGHWRVVGGGRRKKKKGRPAPPRGAYFIAEDSTGRKCGHHHRTRSGARRCANSHQRQEAVYRARHMTRKQARTTRVRRWDVTEKKGR